MFWDKYRVCISSSISIMHGKSKGYILWGWKFCLLTPIKWYKYNGWNDNHSFHIIFSSSSIKLDRNLMKFLGKEKTGRSILITYQVGASYQMNDSIKRGVTCWSSFV